MPKNDIDIKVQSLRCTLIVWSLVQVIVSLYKRFCANRPQEQNISPRKLSQKVCLRGCTLISISYFDIYVLDPIPPVIFMISISMDNDTQEQFNKCKWALININIDQGRERGLFLKICTNDQGCPSRAETSVPQRIISTKLLIICIGTSIRMNILS